MMVPYTRLIYVTLVCLICTPHSSINAFALQSKRWNVIQSRRTANLLLATTAADSAVVSDSPPQSSSPIQQLIVRFDCDEVDSEEISELLFEAGTLSVSVEVESEKAGVFNDETRWQDLSKTRSWAKAVLRANVPASFDTGGLESLLSVMYPDISFVVEVRDVEIIDWVQHVQQSWPPQIIGDLTVRFPWHDKEEVGNEVEVSEREGVVGEAGQQKVELVLEGGAAFGTGDHPTTRLCCKWLQRCIANSRSSSSSRSSNGQRPSVLDYGCGSAILGLASLRFGAATAVGTDIDLDALLSARNNCLMNDLHMDFYLADGGPVEADTYGDQKSIELTTLTAEEQSILSNKFRGSNYGGASNCNTAFPSVVTILEKYPQRFDLTVANILAPILRALAPQLAALTKSGGKIALSGLLKQQASFVMESFVPYFDDLIVEEAEDDWVLITGVRK